MVFNPDRISKDPVEDDIVEGPFVYHDTRVGAGDARPFSAARRRRQRVSLAAALPSPYTVATTDRTIQPEWQRRMARERLGVDPIEIAGGHCPNVLQPDTFAEILIDVARTRLAVQLPVRNATGGELSSALNDRARFERHARSA